MQKAMTTGSPAKAIFAFTLPIFIGNVFQQFYSLADTVIVGKFLGDTALAAVGSTGTLGFLIFGLTSGMSIGFTVPTAQYFGAGDLKKMRRSFASALMLSAFITVLLTALGMSQMRNILDAMHTPEDIYEGAYDYIIVITGGIFAQVLYNLLSSILRALGNSKAALYFLILAAVLNIGLDLLCVITLNMGTAGAAYATVASQAVSGILCLVYIWKKVAILRLRRQDFKPDWRMMGNQFRIGLPMALQYSITAIGTTFVQISLNLLGDSSYIAGFTAGNKVENVVTQAFVALGTAAATYGAQNVGAGKYDRIRKGFRAAALMGAAYAVVMGAVTALFGKYLTYLFVEVGDNTAIVDYVNTYLVCVSLFFLPLMAVNLYRNGIQGMGYGFMPMMAGVAELLGRAIFASVGTRFDSYTLVCLASPAAWVLAGGLLLIMYYFIMRKHKGPDPEDAPAPLEETATLQPLR